MFSEQRIRELCAQLFRAENPLVAESVAAQLHVAIDDYLVQSKHSSPAIELFSIESSPRYVRGPKKPCYCEPSSILRYFLIPPLPRAVQQSPVALLFIGGLLDHECLRPKFCSLTTMPASAA